MAAPATRHGGWDGSLDAPIDVTELGSRTSAFAVWTGTEPDGTVASSHCLDWESGGPAPGRTGAPWATSAAWTAHTYNGCAVLVPIYCFSQAELP